MYSYRCVKFSKMYILIENVIGVHENEIIKNILTKLYNIA